MASRSQKVQRTQYVLQNEFGTPLKSKKEETYNIQKLDHISLDSTNANHENKLPINLFYTAAQYNKMLITNGRSIKRKSEPIIQGFINNLQFINDSIFQSCQQRRETFKQKHKQTKQNSARKPVNSFTQDCICCCCDNFCQTCAKQQNKKCHDTKKQKENHKLSQIQLQKALQRIKSKSVKKKLQNKKKIITSEKYIKPMDKTKQKQRQQKNSKGIPNSQKQCSSSYLSHKSFNIQNLVCKSLIHFQEQKRNAKLMKVLEKQKKIQHDILMKKFQQQVRIKNRELSRSRSTNNNKSIKKNSPTKKQIRFGYWESIKKTISQSLQKDKIYGIKSKSLDKYKNMTECDHKITISPEQIKTLALIHEMQTKAKIASLTRQTSMKKKKIKKNLKQVQKHRIQHLKSCDKKKFAPTQQMINEAFKNIIDQKQLATIEHTKSQNTIKKRKR